MIRPFGMVLLLLLAGCGAGESAVAVTPVMADTKGTYRLVSSRSAVASSGAESSFVSYSAGVLRLTDSSFNRSVTNHGQQISTGSYLIGTSVNTILNSRNGSFSFTSTDPPVIFTGSYEVVPDFTLTLNYDPLLLPDGSLGTRSDTWVKESDSPRH